MVAWEHAKDGTPPVALFSRLRPLTLRTRYTREIAIQPKTRERQVLHKSLSNWKCFYKSKFHIESQVKAP